MDQLSCSLAFGSHRLQTLDELNCHVWSPALTRAQTPDPPGAGAKSFGESLHVASALEEFAGPPTPPAVGQLASFQLLKEKLQKLERSSQPPPGLEDPSTSACIAGSEGTPPWDLTPHPSKVGAMNQAIAFVPPTREVRGVAPPPPQVVARPPRRKASAKPDVEPSIAATVPVVSVGSIGHPTACADACPYVKRKGGCRDGATCPHCHLCFWQRPCVRDAAAAAHTADEVKTGDDAARRINLPAWALKSASAPAGAAANNTVGKAQAREGAALVGDNSSPSDSPPSVGSIGHPHACGQACKYHNKSKGCKDGSLCIRCHLCHWRRYLS